MADRRGPTGRSRSRYRQVLGRRGRSPGRGLGPTGAWRHGHRRHLSTAPLFLVGQADRARSRIGLAATGPAWHHVSGRKQMTSTAVRTTTLKWNSINVGDEVTPMDVPVTTT